MLLNFRKKKVVVYSKTYLDSTIGAFLIQRYADARPIGYNGDTTLEEIYSRLEKDKEELDIIYFVSPVHRIDVDRFPKDVKIVEFVLETQKRENEDILEKRKNYKTVFASRSLSREVYRYFNRNASMPQYLSILDKAITQLSRLDVPIPEAIDEDTLKIYFGMELFAKTNITEVSSLVKGSIPVKMFRCLASSIIYSIMKTLAYSEEEYIEIDGKKGFIFFLKHDHFFQMPIAYFIFKHIHPDFVVIINPTPTHNELTVFTTFPITDTFVNKFKSLESACHAKYVLYADLVKGSFYKYFKKIALKKSVSSSGRKKVKKEVEEVKETQQTQSQEEK